MELLYFGRTRSLLGARSEARGRVRQTGVLLCPSIGMEYLRTYRGLFLFADQLAARGFETMRFDYSCTGDSAGDAREARVEHWVEDIGTAAKELRDLSGCSRICVLGLRMGGLLAATALHRGLKADRLLMWDPPANGAEWLSNVRKLDRAHYDRKNLYRSRSSVIPAAHDEVLGMPIEPALAKDLEVLDRATANGKASSTLVASSRDQPQTPDLENLVLADDANWTGAAWITTPWAPPASFAALIAKMEQWLP